MADDQVGLDAVGTPQLGQRQLHADQAQLDLLDADEFFAVGQHVVQREAGLLDEDGFQFGDGVGESRFVGQQLATHAGPLRAASGVDEHGARPGGAVVRVDHAGSVFTGGQGAQSGDRLVAVAGDDAAELDLPGPVMIHGVGHIGQGHVGAGPLHPIGQHPCRRGHASRRLTRHHQRRHLGVGGGLVDWRQFWTLLDDGMRIRPAQAEGGDGRAPWTRI